VIRAEHFEKGFFNMPITKQWPGGATNATPTSFSLPLNNELNWLQLTSFLQSLADSAQGTTFQKFKVRVVTASPDTISATADCILAVNVAGAVTINLPAGAEKQIFFIVDSSGAAATNNITITPNGSETVRGGASLVLNKNYQGVVLAFTGTDWKAFGPFTTPGSITDADFTGQLSTAKGGTGQNSTATFPTNGTVATVPASGVVKSSGTALTSSNVDLTAEVTGTLPIANGGTGITSFGTGVQTALGANVTGSGSIVLAAAPTISGIPTFTNTALMTAIHITPTGGTGYIQLAEQSSAPTTAGANSLRLYVKSDNNLYLKDELGTEYPVGGQFTWILNQIGNPSESDNWAVTGGSLSTTQGAAQLPLTPLIGTAVRHVPSVNGQYARYRWTMAAPFASQRMRLYFAYITSAVASGDFVVEVYTNTLSNYTGTYTKVALDSDVTGVSNLAAGTSFYESTFVADASLIYYEIRFVRVTSNASAINLSAVTVSPMLVSYGLGAAVGKSLILNATGGSGYLELAEQSGSPGTPSSGFGRIYAKTDNKLYFKNDAGTEVELGIGSTIATSTIQAADASGIAFKENGATTTGSIADDGSWVFGISQASNPGKHIIYGTQGTIANQNYVLEKRSNDISTNDVAIRYGLDRTNGQGFQDCAIQGVGGAGYRFAANTTDVGGHTSGGAWTFGSSSGTSVHLVQGGANSGSGTGAPLNIKNTTGGETWRVGPTNNNGFVVFNGSDTGLYVTNGQTSWTSTSDVRMKKNVYDSKFGLHEIMSLRPVTFDYLTDVSEVSSRVGFIAQEVRNVLPHASYTPKNPDEMMGVSPTELIPVLVKAIQELKAEIDELKNR
jgi:hypothetical protein